MSPHVNLALLMSGEVEIIYIHGGGGVGVLEAWGKGNRIQHFHPLSPPRRGVEPPPPGSFPLPSLTSPSTLCSTWGDLDLKDI